MILQTLAGQFDTVLGSEKAEFYYQDGSVYPVRHVRSGIFGRCVPCKGHNVATLFHRGETYYSDSTGNLRWTSSGMINDGGLGDWTLFEGWVVTRLFKGGNWYDVFRECNDTYLSDTLGRSIEAVPSNRLRIVKCS